MSILVLQTIIKQWDKGQRTEKQAEQRAEVPDQYPINFPPAYYVFNSQCVIDSHGDDLLGDRVTVSQSDNGKIQLDRFQYCFNSKLLEYTGEPHTDSEHRTIGSTDNQWIQCKYDGRYSVFEGGFYYWLYEDVTINVTSVRELSESLFLNSEPAIFFAG